MSAIRVDCGSEDSRRTVLSIFRSMLCEIPGATGAGITFPAYNLDGQRGVVEVRPFGEKYVEIEVVRE